jgi:hypothetical protein
VLTERDREMAAFHVRRFSDAWSSATSPNCSPNTSATFATGRLCIAAEEMRP